MLKVIAIVLLLGVVVNSFTLGIEDPDLGKKDARWFYPSNGCDVLRCRKGFYCVTEYQIHCRRRPCPRLSYCKKFKKFRKKYSKKYSKKFRDSDQLRSEDEDVIEWIRL